ncbi:nitroreductase [Longispora sp. NPDC051575]|uniref:Acg family FMN-binding oxidoreductase n=1 Tax=Longispora sp. NPDC051575 TaxID=3154943 RepID=UPI003426B164
MSIHFTDTDPTRRARASAGPLGLAALTALRAPSLFNTQPWRWDLHDDVADLRADLDRQLVATDPDSRLLIVSCGTALHHALVALAAAGHTVEVRRLPDPSQPTLLARLVLTGRRAPTPMDLRLVQAIAVRRSDRRPFTAIPVPGESVEALRDAAERHGAHLQFLRDEQVVELTVAGQHASDAEFTDPAYRAELGAWTHRPPHAADGVPADAAVATVPRRVVVRDFAPAGDAALPPGTGTDAGTRYGLLFTDTDAPADWLAAGEAMSAVLLAAVCAGLAASPMSDITEVPAVREDLRRRILAGLGWPVLALRFGTVERPGTVPRSPRRDPGQEPS